MKLRKRERMLVIFMSVVVFFFVMDRLVCRSSKTQPSPQKAKVARTNPFVPKNLAQKKSKARKSARSRRSKIAPLRWHYSWGKDPFLKAYEMKSGGARGARQLKAISRRGKEVYVVIDDLILREGEAADGLEVIRVEGDKVICRENGKIFVLSLR